jgi:hypothetical protein
MARLALDPNDEEALAAMEQVAKQTEAMDNLEREGLEPGPI